jgi:hypothetical protein
MFSLSAKELLFNAYLESVAALFYRIDQTAEGHSRSGLNRCPFRSPDLVPYHLTESVGAPGYAIVYFIL